MLLVSESLAGIVPLLENPVGPVDSNFMMVWSYVEGQPPEQSTFEKYHEPVVGE